MEHLAMSESHLNARLLATKMPMVRCFVTGELPAGTSRARSVVAGCEQLRISACWPAPGWLVRSHPQDRVLQLPVIPCASVPIAEPISVYPLPEY